MHLVLILYPKVEGMKYKTYKDKIIAQCINKGTYNENDRWIIEALARILAERDSVFEQYEDEGSHPMIEYTNKNGSTNLVKNPLLSLWVDLNSEALSYWKELGLTPASFGKIKGAKSPVTTGGLVEVLGSLNCS